MVLRTVLEVWHQSFITVQTKFIDDAQVVSILMTTCAIGTSLHDAILYVFITKPQYSPKKIAFINDVQAMLLQSVRVLEMHFLVIWRPEFQKFSFQCKP